MELSKLKRLLAEGNPDRQLENILENLSEGSKIPIDRQRARADAAEAKADKSEAELNQLKLAMKQAKDDPVLFNQLKRKMAELEGNEARANVANSFVGETMKEIRKGDRDPMTGIPINEIASKIKFGSKAKQNLEPSVKSPDPESDYNQNGIKDNKEENLMEKEQKALFEKSMENIFKILREEEDEEKTEEEIMVGEVPAVESPEVEEEKEEVEAEEPVLEPEVQANDADVAVAEPAAEVPAEEIPAEEATESEEEEAPAEVEEAIEASESETVEVPVEAEPEVMVTDDSIRIEIPLSSDEKLVPEIGEVEAEALQEAFRTVYRILANANLLEDEHEEGHEVEIPEEAEAEVKVEGDHLVVEIPLKDPKEEVSQEEAEELQEAVAVISFLLKEELGDAAAEPVHTEEEPKEHTPEVENKDVIDGQHAEEVKEVVVESELGDAAAEPVHSEEEPKEHTPELENKDVLPAEEHQQAEEVKEVVVESEKKEELTDEEKKKPMVDASKEELEKLIRVTGSKQKPVVNPGVVKPIKEELGDAAAEPVHSEEKPEEHTPEVENKDVIDGQHAEEIKEVVVESEEPNSKEVNHAGSDTIDSDGELAKDEEASENKEESEVKAEPKDVVESYGSLREAFLLENGYFEKDSFEKVTADRKKSKLVEQISLLVARDVQDPLYEELLRTTAIAKNLQEKLQAKYNAVAKKKAGQLLDAKKIK